MKVIVVATRGKKEVARSEIDLDAYDVESVDQHAGTDGFGIFITLSEDPTVGEVMDALETEQKKLARKPRRKPARRKPAAPRRKTTRRRRKA